MSENQNERVEISQRGVMLVVSSPSGAGKTTLTRRLLENDPSTTLSVSVTTRAPREGEVDGRDYHFISQQNFAVMRDSGALLEYAQVFGNAYGTPRATVEAQLSMGQNILFDIDWQGAEQLKVAMPGDVVSVFILPPSARALMQRLVTRAQDSHEVIGKRMRGAAQEISHWSDYDHVIVNDDFEVAYDELRTILAAERRRRVRRPDLTNFVSQLQRELTGMLDSA